MKVSINEFLQVWDNALARGLTQSDLAKELGCSRQTVNGRAGYIRRLGYTLRPLKSGHKLGGAKAAATNKAKYGDDFYARIGATGGKLGKTGGFYANRELARIAGAKGGRKSRRGPTKKLSDIGYKPQSTDFWESEDY